ncbi:putative RNA-directed DNA polymerase [Helianthus annuus]|nr:putative RNA-directed DNA polymerase [Helianthus annuus]
MNYLSINLRGAGDSEKARWVRRLVTEHRVSFVAIQETQLKAEMCSVDASGRSGGLVSLWNTEVLSNSSVITGTHFINVSGFLEGVNVPVHICNVYAPNNLTRRRSLWDELLKLKNNLSGIFLFIGDFNEVRHENERLNSNFDSYGAYSFNNFIRMAGLIEYKMVGGRFTYITDDGTKLSKLDRVLVCDNFMALWPHASVIALKWELSDHRPLILSSCEKDFGPVPFKFYNHWLGWNGLEEIVMGASVLGNTRVRGDVAINLILKQIKEAVKKWKEMHRAREEHERSEATKLLQELNSTAESRSLCSDELAKRVYWKQVLKKIDKNKSKEIVQKARVDWTKYGDENTSFFHKLVKIKTAKKRISSIVIDGERFSDPMQMKEAIRLAFKRKFDEPMKRRPSLIVTEFKKLSLSEARRLTTRFSEEEIKAAVWGCGGDKSPGPDGFTFKFLKKFWHLLKNRFFEMMAQFYDTGRISRGCNSSFFTLIPKVNDPQSLSHYRPISLIGIIYKVVAKTLANRLKGVIDSVSSTTQSAFVAKRNIFDGPIIVSEVVSWAKKQKTEILLFKVDFDKAYDSINWNFLLNNLKMMGFPKRWRKWVEACLVSGKASVLVNGSPSKEFSIKRGLRQGDPLSPFLFIIALEVLEVFMKRVCRLGFFEGVTLPNGGPVLTHLAYADDVIFLGMWSKRNILNLKRILRCLYLVSGLKVNMKKSNLMGVGVDDAAVDLMAKEVRCQPGSLPFTFLGLPIGENMKRIKPWKPIIDKFHKKLSGWKARNLSMAGRITLAKAVLGNLPSYYLSIFKAPVKVINTLEGIRRTFVWGKVGEKNKLPWVAWGKIQAPKHRGGLGLGEIRSLNWAFLYKWRWRFRNFPNQLWVSVIQAIHGHQSDNIQVPLKKDVTGLWKDILGVEKDVLKAGVMATETLGRNDADGQQPGFSVSEFRRQIAEKIGLKVEVGAFKWNSWVPSKVSYFVWKLIQESIPVKTALIGRGLCLNDAACNLCGYGSETAEHLATSCVLVRAVWWHVRIWLKIPINMQVSSVQGVLEELAVINGSRKWKKTIEAIFYTTWWRIWKGRNNALFDRIPFSVGDVVESIKEDSFMWIKYRSPYTNVTWENWRDFNVRDVIM